MKSDKSPKSKRCSTRHISEITAIASEFGNSAKIIVPRSWLGKRIIALAINPYDVDALNGKGWALNSLGNYTGAIQHYDKALAIDPQYVLALSNKGAALGNLGNHTGAILYYDKALAVNPKDEDVLYNKGNDLAALGNYSVAIEYYDKALAVNPHDVDALYRKGLALKNLGNYTGAILYYDKALAINPHDVQALNSKGLALANLGNPAEAIPYFDKALAIDPYDIDALTNKATILDRLGNNTTPGNVTKFLEYENSTYGIKMQYPSNWSVEGGSNPAIIASFYPRSYANYVMIQIENLSTGYTPDQYLNSLMLGDAADHKDFPDIRFSQNTTNNIILAGHPGYLLNGTFRHPTSDALQMFTNIGTIIGDKVYSVIYYSPAETYPIYNMKYLQMIKSFEVVPQKSSPENTTAHATNELSTLTITIPPDWGRIDKLM
jgi:Flp pilus assembly protein TadD